MAESLDGLGQYLHRLRSWRSVEPPPLALLHRWEKELGLKDADIRAVHQLALTHRRRGLDLLKEGKPEFVAELREALALEPSDASFLRHIIVELSRHEYGGENWNALLNRLFTRYVHLSPDPEAARVEIERLFPRFKFRKKETRTALAIAAGIAIAFLIGGGGLTIAWFALRGGGTPPPTAAARPPTVDWSGLQGGGLSLEDASFRQIPLGEDAFLVVRGRLTAREAPITELVIGLVAAIPGEDSLRRYENTLVSAFTPPLLPGQSVPFRWVIPTVPDAPAAQNSVRIEKLTLMSVPPPPPPPEFPAGRALAVGRWPIRVQRTDGLVYAVQDLSIRNTADAPLRLLTLALRWKAGDTDFWREEKPILQALDTPLGPSGVQTTRFRLLVPASVVPEGELHTEYEVLEEERS